LLFISPSPNIDVGIDDDPKEVGEEDDKPSVELFDVGKFIIVGEYVGDVLSSFFVGDKELEEPPCVVLEVGGDDSSPILYVEFVIAVDIIDGESDVSKPS